MKRKPGKGIPDMGRAGAKVQREEIAVCVQLAVAAAKTITWEALRDGTGRSVGTRLWELEEFLLCLG